MVLMVKKLVCIGKNVFMKFQESEVLFVEVNGLV